MILRTWCAICGKAGERGASNMCQECRQTLKEIIEERQKQKVPKK